MMNDMLREKLIALLKPFEPMRISVFGSYARGEERSDSDLDILIAFKNQIGLLKLVQIEQELSEKLNVEIDLVTENSLKDPILKEHIERDLIRIFG
jgi:hypothetical protein